MAERFEQRRVKLAELITHGEYASCFVQRPNETRAQLKRRLVEQERIQDLLEANDGRLVRYAARVARGQKMPPVIVTSRGDEYFLIDGWHRCAAAALAGQRAISAVVFNTRTQAEDDLISDLAFEYSEVGVHWTESVRRIAAALGAADA